MISVPPQLETRALSVGIGTRALIASLNLTLESGEVLGILGPNGAGKSSLLTLLAGLATPAQGQVTLDGQAITLLPPLVRAQHIGLLPQGDDGGFFGNVMDFITLGRYPFRNTEYDTTLALSTWDLLELAQRPLDTLSGGERQRARLAQLSVQNPQISLLDEPLTHLDPAHQARLLAWARAQADAGKSIVLTLHDPNWAASHCDRLLFLYGDGRWQMGTPHTLLTSTALESLYGEESARLWQSL